MSRKAENWLLVEWTDGSQNVVYVKSVLSPDNKELKVGEPTTVNWQGEPRSAVLKERSCNREELEAKSKKNQPGPSSESGSNDEGEDFSASGSSWAPSDDGALSNDSYTEKPAKKVKLEKNKRQYVNRRTSKKIIIPSHRANAVIPKIMQTQGVNSKNNERKNESCRKRSHNETVRNNSFNKTAPDSTIVQQNNKGKNNKRCSLDMKVVQEIGDTFRSLFQMIRELKKPYENTTPNTYNPNISKRLSQNISNLNISNPNIGRKLYQNTPNLNTSYPNIGKKLHQNTSNLNTSYPNIGKKLYQNTSTLNTGKKVYQNTPNPNTSSSNIGTNLYHNTSHPNVFNPNIGKKLYQNTSNPNIGQILYQIPQNTANNPNISKIYDVPILQQELVVEAIDPTEEVEETAEYENEEFNRSDDNVLITNKYDNKEYSQNPTEDNTQYSRNSTEDNKQYTRKPTEDNKQYSRNPTEDNKQYSRKSTEDNKQYTRKPTAGSSKEEEWVAIGSGKTLIHADQFRKVNWRSYTVATRTLLLAVFPRRVLATHSLTGKKSPAFQDKPAKMCLDPKIISDVIMEIQDRFDVKENLIRSIITTKCADECKMLRMRKNRNAAKKGNRENEPPNVKFEEDKKKNV